MLLCLPVFVRAHWLETTIPVRDNSRALLFNPACNKVCCANIFGANMTVIKGMTDSAIANIGVEDEPWTLTWNQVKNRTYVANQWSDNVSVICDSLTGVEENESLNVANYSICKTIFFGPLQLPEGKKCKVFDITGRVVMPEAMEPGVYFIEVDGVVVQKVIKIR